LFTSHNVDYARIAQLVKMHLFTKLAHSKIR
jgi:hypothetical protein